MLLKFNEKVTEMKIVRPYASLLKPHRDMTADDVQRWAMSHIEWCGRISHRSEDAQTADSWRRFVDAVVIKHGDWSIVEHVSVSVDCLVDRGITHEIVRHRLFSYTQESTRFVNYEKKIPPSFIYPKPDVECEHCLFSVPFHELTSRYDKVWHHKSDEHNDPPCRYDSYWLCAISEVERDYKQLLAGGWRPQEARSVFPNALASRIIITGNLRNWRHFFIMRTTAEAHPQMRQVTIPLLAEFKSTFPILFDDIEPMAKQSEGMKRIR